MDHVEIQIFTGQILFKKKERKKEKREREILVEKRERYGDTLLVER